MRDPREGLDDAGLIVTGARRDRVPVAFEPVLDEAAARLADTGAAETAELHLYGSVATGMARIGHSDVDLITIGVAPREARRIGRELSARHTGLCRGVAVGAARPQDFAGDDDAAYGNRVFLRHYAVTVAGPDRIRPTESFPGDAAAARGFNGDIAARLELWRERRATPRLGRAVARKTLLALAGLVSVHDGTWTTDRATAAARWGELRPELTPPLSQLLAWAEGATASPASVAAALEAEGVVASVVTDFADQVGLWA